MGECIKAWNPGQLKRFCGNGSRLIPNEVGIRPASPVVDALLLN